MVKIFLILGPPFVQGPPIEVLNMTHLAYVLAFP